MHDFEVFRTELWTMCLLEKYSVIHGRSLPDWRSPQYRRSGYGENSGPLIDDLCAGFCLRLSSDSLTADSSVCALSSPSSPSSLSSFIVLKSLGPRRNGGGVWFIWHGTHHQSISRGSVGAYNIFLRRRPSRSIGWLVGIVFIALDWLYCIQQPSGVVRPLSLFRRSLSLRSPFHWPNKRGIALPVKGQLLLIAF